MNVPSLIDTSPNHWTRDAACANTDGDAFYPEQNGDFKTPRRVCGRCPSKVACLDDAMTEEVGRSHSSRYGVRGGLFPAQRHKLEAAWLAEREVSA